MTVALLCTVGVWAAADFASATYSDPYSITISNSTFDSDVNDWTVSVFGWHSPGIAEVYDKKTQDCSIKRTISDLKAGHYQFSASALARGNISSEKVYLYIGDKKQYIFAESLSTYTIDYDLTADGSVEIGLKCEANYVPIWVALDNVELKYYGSTEAYNDYIALRKVSSLDLTWAVQSADFTTGNGGWITAGTSIGNQQSGSGAMESWNNNNVTVSQSIAVPNGKYRVTVDMISGNDTKQAYLFASSGDKTVTSSVVTAQAGSGRDNYANMCEDVANNTLTIDNFSVSDGSITIGVKDPSNGGWIVFDNFTLTRIADSDGTDMTSYIVNAAVSSTSGWSNGRTNSGQQYTDAPDNTYMDTWNGTLNQYQYISLPAGHYLLKVATRADATLTASANVYALVGETNNSTTIHKEGDSGNLLGNGWGWTYVPFSVSKATKVSIGFYSECGGSKWAGADDFHLYYYTSELAMKQAHLAQVVADANTWANKVTTTTALETALAASAPSCSTVEECNTAISNLETTIANARATEAPYAEFNRIKACANSIKNVEYTLSVDGAYTTFTAAIPAQTTAAEEATTAAAVNTAINTLKAAVKTYINAAEPKNESEYFDITCLIENPSFDNNTTTGWTYTKTGGTNAAAYTCNEFFNNTFDFYQNLTGLANGSYQLTVQAYSRPGDNGNADAGAYKDYKDGTNNVTAELYVNSDASRVGNIYAYKGNTTGAKVEGNDFHCNISPDDYWVPNNMQGASLYFADEDVYKTEVAALVEDGNLKIGFRDNTLTTNQWTIFDNFHLYYYGSSKLVYYQQYLPQLRAEVCEDLNNGAYASVLVSSEDEALDAALAANPASETEEAYETVIDNLRTAQTNFRAAATPYNAIVEEKAASAITKISENVGTGVFQYNESTNNSLYSAYETARASVTGYTFTTSSTAAEAQTLVDALNDAIDNYNNQTLNAPDAGKRYVLTIVEDGKTWDGNAVTFRENCGDNADQGNFGIKYQTTTNANYNQAIKFTATTGNKYKLSVVRADGTEMYLTTQKKGYNKDDGSYGDERIRMTSDASKALEIEIRATSTDNQFQLYNSTAPGIIANNNNNDMYTANSCNFTIAEASQASVTVSAKAGKYGTVIFPFKPDVSTGFDGITFYSIDGINDVTNRVILNNVANPVANTPYIVENASGENFSKVVAGWGAAYKDEYDSGETNIKLTGVYTAATITKNANNYVLQTQKDASENDVQAFYLVSGENDFTATAYKCYLTYSAGNSVKALYFDFNGATGINAIDNGQLTMKDVTIFNLAGQRVEKAQKGIYIVNGKKVLIK